MDSVRTKQILLRVTDEELAIIREAKPGAPKASALRAKLESLGVFDRWPDPIAQVAADYEHTPYGGKRALLQEKWLPVYKAAGYPTTLEALERRAIRYLDNA